MIDPEMKQGIDLIQSAQVGIDWRLLTEVPSSTSRSPLHLDISCETLPLRYQYERPWN
jgi:hypothetical protein